MLRELALTDEEERRWQSAAEPFDSGEEKREGDVI